jgi:hypothetical protein
MLHSKEKYFAPTGNQIMAVQPIAYHYTYNILSEIEKRTCGSPKHEWEDNSKLDLKAAEYQDVNWIHLAQAHEKDQ